MSGDNDSVAEEPSPTSVPGWVTADPSPAAAGTSTRPATLGAGRTMSAAPATEIIAAIVAASSR